MRYKFLILQTAFLGDVVLATALAEKLHQEYPEAAIDFLLRKGNEPLLKGHPFLRQTLVFDKQKKVRSMVALIRHLRKERYDLLVNVQRFASSGIIAALSGAREIVGFDKNPFAFAFSRAYPHRIEAAVHETMRNLSLLEGWTDGQNVAPRLYPPPEAYADVPREPYICIAPTSVWFTKQWPAEKWAAFIRSLPGDLTIALLGGPADHAACAYIRETAGHPRALNKAGALTLLESAAWMQGALMNYANDSAPIHIASAVGAPVTAIFCSTVPAFGFGPLSPVSRVVEVPGELPCRPCGLHGFRACPRGDFRCAEIPLALLTDGLPH
ncbi:MAG: hypothetical protein RL386_1980 [Bacteroidota bacterium]